MTAAAPNLFIPQFYNELPPSSFYEFHQQQYKLNMHAFQGSPQFHKKSYSDPAVIPSQQELMQAPFVSLPPPAQAQTPYDYSLFNSPPSSPYGSNGNPFGFVQSPHGNRATPNRPTQQHKHFVEAQPIAISKPQFSTPMRLQQQRYDQQFSPPRAAAAAATSTSHLQFSHSVPNSPSFWSSTPKFVQTATGSQFGSDELKTPNHVRNLQNKFMNNLHASVLPGNYGDDEDNALQVKKVSPWSKAGDISVKDTKPVNLMGLPSLLRTNGDSSSNPASDSSFFNTPLFPPESKQQHYQTLSQASSSRFSYPPGNVAQASVAQAQPQFSSHHVSFANYAVQPQQQFHQNFVNRQTQHAAQPVDNWADSYVPKNQKLPCENGNLRNSLNNGLQFRRSVPVRQHSFEGSSLNQMDDRGGKYKDLLVSVKEMEKQGYWKIKLFLEHNISNLEVQHWKVCMEMADIAKRENLFDEAREWYTKVNELEPKSPQGWLEHAKLEEECGELDRSEELLRLGLEVPQCKYNESLIIKYIKLQEQASNFVAARVVLARLKNYPVDKCWKIILEGALLESRAGNIEVARKIFKYLTQHVPRHGPIYYEAYRLEEKCENYEEALAIVTDGLNTNPRYGPLWFAAFHLFEKLGKLDSVRHAIQEAVKSISKELIWKVYFESAQIEERAGNLDAARAAYVNSVENALENLRWKVWLAGARTELNAKNIEHARLLLNRALTEVPAKSKAVVLIECARLEEYVGNLEKARGFLKRAQKEAKHEWKVFLESILLEMRAGEHQRAVDEAHHALDIHRGTGRLWAVLIQLKHLEGEEEQVRVFKEALEEVPKSGEVWCEGARIRLNPLSAKFNLNKARRYLEFAIKFTPQYGDSLIEYLRLELLQMGPRVEQEENKYIEQLCVNADPNYGPLWVHCKEHPLDSTRHVLRRAKDVLMKELVQFRHVYQRAILRFSTKSKDIPLRMRDESGNMLRPRDFITGLHSLNELLLSPLFHGENDDEEQDSLRKKFIFGSELSI